MKTISIWASKNQKLAIAFIIIIELLKGLMGAVIGNDLLPILSNATIELSVLFIVFFISFIQINYRHHAINLSKERFRQLRLKNTTIIFLSSFLLAILLGNHFKGIGYSIDNQFISYAGVTIKSDSLQQKETTTVFEKILKQNQIKDQLLSNNKAEKSSSDTGKRIGYVLLFVLSLVLTYVGVALSCSIACSGYGVLAILALLLSLGIFSGGIYFLIKSFRKTINSSTEMTHEEKRKERRRFFAIWGIVTALLALLIVFTNV
ncbi:hypothetical protein [Emticicia sp. SJ17W-69]|uniref:hypothetical protein n=1 Tax=Emticicia sp. SJ17W-69 TaxID=3421657 RepID=UPI003EB9207E